ncbi:MAG TPA: guanylate kinase [Candidatus Omnitrophica bacterium]|nr:guanylate kinase [Candidatus Omnitrophota bacterium]
MVKPKVANKRKRVVFIVSGPSGSGKTTLIKQLLKRNSFKKSVVKVTTFTTRAPRGKERDGRDYIFIKPAEFKKQIKRGEFLEWQKVLGQYYGTPKAAVAEYAASGKDVILCIDVKGAKSLKQNRSFCFSYIFILPSAGNWRVTLAKRLKMRSSETTAQVRARLELAEKEIMSSNDYEYIIINKNINQATEELGEIILSERKWRKKTSK